MYRNKLFKIVQINKLRDVKIEKNDWTIIRSINLRGFFYSNLSLIFSSEAIAASFFVRFFLYLFVLHSLSKKRRDSTLASDSEPRTYEIE